MVDAHAGARRGRRPGPHPCPRPVLEHVADILDEVAEECRPSSESFVNPAKVLATGLGETVPVVLGDGLLTGVAAIRAASMLARTARVPATHGFLPDAASQVVACLDGPFGSGLPRRPGSGDRDDIFADPYLDGPAAPRLGLLALRDPDLDPGRRRPSRMPSSRPPARREPSSSSRRRTAVQPIERLASLVALTDFAATYLALGLGLDPSVSRHVVELSDRTS